MRAPAPTRLRATLTHLLASAGLVGAGFGTLFWLWYSPGLWNLAGISRTLWMLLAGATLAGPLMTLVAFRPNKPGLRTDMAVIAAIQIAFLALAVFAFGRVRPVFLVAAMDRFELVRAAELDPKDLAAAKAEYRHLPWTGPQVVGIDMPEDNDARYQLIMSGLAGKDVHLLPRLYTRYQASAAGIARKALPLSTLAQQGSTAKQRLEAALANSGRTAQETTSVPIRGPNYAASTMLIDRTTGEIVQPVAINPWQDEAIAAEGDHKGQ